jgi:hypothetical protein
MATANPELALEMVLEKLCPERLSPDGQPMTKYEEAVGIVEGKFLVNSIPDYEHLLAFYRVIKAQALEIQSLKTRNEYLESDEFAQFVGQNMIDGEAAGKDYQSDLLEGA